MAMVFTSRVLGLMRDRLLASYFTKETLGVYLAAFRLPNLIFELLIMGIVSTAFIPVFMSYIAQRREEEGFRMATHVINSGMVVLVIASVISFLFARPISQFFAPGFSEGEIRQMTLLTQIILAGQLIPLVLGNFLTGILQSYQRFIIPALAPVVYNMGIIIGTIVLSPHMGLFGPAWGVVLGAVLFCIIQIPFVLTLGYRYQLSWSLKDQGVRKVLKLMLPRTFGLAISQIDTTVDLMLATFLGAGSVTIFYFAQHLQQFPVGLFGATIAQAALPSLSEVSAKKDNSKFEELFLASYHQILFLVLPISMLLLVLRIPMVRLVFGAARFDWDGTVLTGRTLAFFSLSLFAQSLVQLLARAFYALHDSKTPVAIGMLAVVLNTCLSILLVLILHLGVWSLALSTSIASIFNFLLLLVLLNRSVGGISTRGLLIPPLKMLVASAVAGVCLYIPMKLLDQLVFDTTRVLSLLTLTGIASIVGLTVYLFLAWFFNIEEVATFFNLLRKLKRVPQLMFHSEELVGESETPVA